MNCDSPAQSPIRWPVSSLPETLIVAASTIGFLGPRGTFTEVALRASVDDLAPDGRPRSFLPFSSMEETIEAVSTGEVDCAIVPIENSIEGSVSATVDILVHEVDNLQIVREVRIPIRHCLIARPGVTLEQITKVVSHPHANAQCRGWLRRNLPGREIEAANSTANAVERVATSEQPWAAIANELAAKEYGCAILEADIEDHKDNETRFVFLARQRERQDWFEPYKTSIVCEIVKDQPGALLLILQEFSFRHINLTKVESRPSKQRLGDYLFVIDMEGKVDEGPVADALRCLSCKLPRLTVLGSYPVGMPPHRASR
ncbi:MAG TPA: prephenate dehydratase [Thermoleophilia bacterium]|nr:prephenate dehydratase [Thermoleophilia bacterium]